MRKVPTMLEATKVDVKVSRGPDITWLVWLGQRVVGRFTLVGDALAYATILECDPRIRKEALAA
jgi:hypothetical protein